MEQPTEIKIDDITYVRKDVAVSEPDECDGLPYVIVRSREQGVMAGYLSDRFERVVVLQRARQLWQWRSSFLLPDMAELGVTDAGACRFSVEMSQPAEMLEACGILYCTTIAGRSIRAVPAQVK